MTVGELIDLLQDFDDDTEVVIAEYQSRGCNFAYDIGEVGECKFNDWDNDESDGNSVCVQITMGSQIGTMCDDEDKYGG